MQLPICTSIAWLSIVIFALLPKKLSFLDFAFLYGVTLTVITITLTILDINLDVVTIPRTSATSFCIIISRVITIPLFVMAAIDSLQSRNTPWYRVIAITFWIALTGVDWLLHRMHVIQYHGWNIAYASVTCFGFISIAWILTRWFKRFDERIV